MITTSKRICNNHTTEKVWENHVIKMATKGKLLKAFVWPVATYGCESWTLRKANKTRINAFYMKCLRFVLRISWTEKRTNEWALQSAGTERQLLKSVKKRKMTYFGHIMKKNDKCLEKEIIQGRPTTPSSRAKGRPKTSWLGNIRLWTGLTMEERLFIHSFRPFL